MKIQISPSGELEIFRSHGYKTQKCIYTEAKSCGDRCPHFGEPRYLYDHGDKLCFIELCQGRLLKIELSDFQDLRTKPESEYDYNIVLPIEE
jgi:hypothetical protein